MSELADKIKTIGVQRGSLEARRAQKTLDRDLEAYHRLRHQGLHPKGIDGSAMLEQKASSADEIKWGHLMTKDQMTQAREGIEQARELNEENES